MFLLFAAADDLWCAAFLAAVLVKQNTRVMCCSNLLP